MVPSQLLETLVESDADTVCPGVEKREREKGRK